MTVRRALLLATADRYFGMAANFATLAIVSRLLAPGEIGIFVLGSAVVAMALSLRAFGSTTYLIQKVHLSPQEVRGAATAVAAISLIIAAGLAIGAPWIADMCAESRLVVMIRVAALCTIADMVTMVIVALLSRDMAFGNVAMIGMAGTSANAIVGIALAKLGFGFMCFAWAWLASAMASCLLAVYLRPQLRIFLPSMTGWGEMLAYSSRHGCNVVLQEIQSQVPYLLLGRFSSTAAVGNYNRALLVSRLPDRMFLGAVNSIVLPAMSRQVREQREVAQPYLRGVELITGVLWPALLVIAILAYPLLDVLLGHQWVAAAPLLQILALAGLFSFAFQLNYSVLLALGAMRDLFWCSLIVLPSTALIGGVAALFGPNALALSMLVIVPLQAAASFHYVLLHMPVGWRDLAQTFSKSAAVSAASALVPILVLAFNGPSEMSVPLAAAAVLLSAVAWLAALRVTRHPIHDELSPLMRQAHAWGPKRRSGATAISGAPSPH